MATRAISLLALTFICSACSLLFPDRTAPKSANYEITKLNSPWAAIAVGEDASSVDALKADVAYENPHTGSIISLNSLCRKYNNSSLEQLTANLVRGIDGKVIVRQQERMVDGSEGLDSTFTGKVDGVEIQIRTIVVKKNYCTYDFIHVELPKHESGRDLADQSFEQFLSSFKAE